MRAVFDTNVIVSGLLWRGGTPARLIDAAESGRIELFSSHAILAELARVLSRPKFSQAILASTFRVEDLVLAYAALTTIVAPAKIARSASDQDDDEILACALAAQVGIIVSGDADLLNLKSFHGIRIVTPANAAEVVNL